MAWLSRCLFTAGYEQKLKVIMHCYRLYLLCSTSLLFYEALTVPNGDWRGNRVALCNNIVGDKPYDEFAVKISTMSYYSESLYSITQSRFSVPLYVWIFKTTQLFNRWFERKVHMWNSCILYHHYTHAKLGRVTSMRIN